jgi:hypothetical protein
LELGHQNESLTNENTSLAQKLVEVQKAWEEEKKVLSKAKKDGEATNPQKAESSKTQTRTSDNCTQVNELQLGLKPNTDSVIETAFNSQRKQFNKRTEALKTQIKTLQSANSQLSEKYSARKE